VNIVPPAGDGAADATNVRRFTLPRFRAKAARVLALAEASGRDPAAVTLSAIFFVRVVDSASAARTLLDGVAARYGLSPADAERFPLMLIGTAQRLREQLAERIALLDLGYVVLNFASPAELEHFGREVLPTLEKGS